MKTEELLVQKLPGTPALLGGTLDGAGVSLKDQLSELGVSLVMAIARWAAGQLWPGGFFLNLGQCP